MNNRKIIIVALLFLTVILAGVAIYIAQRLAKPTDASVEQFGNCTITDNGNGCFTLVGCSEFNVHRWTRESDVNVCPVGGLTCTTNCGDHTEQTASDGTYCPEPDAGECQQVDLIVNGQERGKCACEPPDTRVACGEVCNTDADCLPPTGGGTSVCRTINGTRRCVNQVCPNNTQPGTICGCTNNTSQCGDRCGNGFPLCDPNSNSTCTYVNGPICSPGNMQPYCVPNTLATGYSTVRCTQGDTGNRYLSGPDNQTVFTQAQIQALCNQVVSTPSPTVTPTPSVTTTVTTTPQSCGGPCTGQPGECATGHQCNLTTGLCVIDACLTNPSSCSANGCSLVETAIESEDYPKIMISLVIITLGITLIKIGLPSRLFMMFTQRNIIRLSEETREDMGLTKTKRPRQF